MRYELYYWTGIQGRGEFVRLALEDAGADYIDVARERGDNAMLSFLQGMQAGALPFAPPFLKAGRLVIAQTALILAYLGPRLGLVPEGSGAEIYAQQLQQTITDFVAEVHDTHHPLVLSEYYEQQRPAARKRTQAFLDERLPKFLGYFEDVIARGNGRQALSRHSYVDLSLFQLVSGLDYAFPNAMTRMHKRMTRLRALAARIAERPNISAYLQSPRRIAFNEDGIFRHYPELDRAR
ncbi:glutathione S-transferase [Dyella acidiphila]|uniref:Glutathione S-transferase n=1 Tax=Dyella acidiphila TaxID=2775866 RepID=A0ABR9G8I3_9GAMM|nr:glutathione S-transferase [Dyella acidiphila]MBE1160332.1 glutathione S-transferase [Dyella acidiphila]